MGGLLQVWMGKEVRVRREIGVGEEEVLGCWDVLKDSQ